MDYTKTLNIKNRSDSTVGYVLSDSGVRRTWSPGEIKKGITVKEIEEVTFSPGGMVILEEYLLINDEEVCDLLGIKTEPEYFYNEEEVVRVLKTGSLDQLLDCLDFAPDGVLDMVKTVSVKIKLNDLEKRDAIKSKLGFDVTKAIDNVDFSVSTEADTVSKRRSAPINAKSEGASTGERRTLALPTYNKVEN